MNPAKEKLVALFGWYFNINLFGLIIIDPEHRLRRIFIEHKQRSENKKKYGKQLQVFFLHHNSLCALQVGNSSYACGDLSIAM
jgi:hypothetical protein